MAYRFDVIREGACEDLTPAQIERVTLALGAAAFYGVLERLAGSSLYAGSRARLETLYDQRVAELRKRSGAENADPRPIWDVPLQPPDLTSTAGLGGAVADALLELEALIAEEQAQTAPQLLGQRLTSRE